MPLIVQEFGDTSVADVHKIDDGGTLELREGRRNLYSLKVDCRGLVFWAYGIGRDSPPRSKTAREMLARWRSGE